jgi:transposase InsO family protein
VTQDDLLYRFRLRTFAMAAELGNVRAACRAMGIHPSTYYRWKHQLDRYGPEILRPRERRTPRMANQTSVLVEQRVVAFALGHPGFGPARIAAELARPKWGWNRVVDQWGLAGATPPRPVHQGQTLWAGRRLCGTARAAASRAGARAPPGRGASRAAGAAGLLLHRPLERDQGNRLAVHRHRCRLRLHLGTLQVTRRNPSATWTSQLARTVAADLAERGWKLERVMSDNASEFRSAVFGQTVATLGARHSFIRAGRPQTNGCVERVQQTILDECWKPAFARYLIPKQTGLRLDLERYLRYYNTERSHTGRWTKGRTPEEVLGKAKLWQRKR